MARLSDIIEEFIKDMFNDSDDGILEIQRNELANYFGCAPSQINYVLMTRFGTNHGYYIESKRGGGGSIKITRISFDKNEYLKELIMEKIGDSITQKNAEAYINSFLENDIITEREAYIMKAAINDRAILTQIEYKDITRAAILKSIILILLNY